MQRGTYNVERTDCPHLTGNDRYMLGMSVDKETAESWLETYRTKYPSGTFSLADNVPPFTCEIPILPANNRRR